MFAVGLGLPAGDGLYWARRLPCGEVCGIPIDQSGFQVGPLRGVLQYYSERLSPFMPGDTREERGRNFLILFSAIAGAIMMLRVLPDQAAQEQILVMVRNHYLATFAATLGRRAS